MKAIIVFSALAFAGCALSEADDVPRPPGVPGEDLTWPALDDRSTIVIDSERAIRQTYGPGPIDRVKYGLFPVIPFDDLVAFYDSSLGPLGFARDPATSHWHVGPVLGNPLQEASWVRDDEEDGRTVIVIAYTRPETVPAPSSEPSTAYTVFFARREVFPRVSTPGVPRHRPEQLP